MAEEKFRCMKCGATFSAIPGAEEPPECPECEKSDVERLEDATLMASKEDKDCR
ncbi:MAG TPA: hypothetical protein V6C97_00260 [Oculatellaceae cyanobacterium]|nr:hypothetical protein [Syntrophorhabdaceae bacterium]